METNSRLRLKSLNIGSAIDLSFDQAKINIL